jgi:fructokinase
VSRSARRLGVDLGGSKIEAALLAPDGRVTVRQRRATPRGDYDATLDVINDLCLAVEAEAGLDNRLPLGIGTPGSPSPQSGLMRNCNSTALNGRRLAQDLEQRCARPVRLANDADCFALSEASDGAGRGYHTVFGVILGTGVGGGICMGSQLLRGSNGIGGEWGHNRLPLERVAKLPDQLLTPRPCYCGRNDCIETWLSGPGLALSHELLHGQVFQPALAHAGAQSAAEAAALADKHRQTIDVYLRLLAAALATVVNILDPDAVVLGGGLSNMEQVYTSLPALLGEQVFSDCCNTDILPAAHGDSSGVRGAAWLWP